MILGTSFWKKSEASTDFVTSQQTSFIRTGESLSLIGIQLKARSRLQLLIRVCPLHGVEYQGPCCRN